MADKKDNTVTQDQIEQEKWNKLEGIFMPYSREQRDKIPAFPFRCAHYTTAEAALKIISTKRIWMRNANCMSDFREVQHGYDILWKWFNDPAKRQDFHSALDECVPGAALEALNTFNALWGSIRSGTFVTSLSEHLLSEDDLGRLSMWRAFGESPARVALIFNVPKYSPGTVALRIIFSPVAYFTEQDTDRALRDAIANAKSDKAFLQSLERQMVVNSIFNMFLMTVTCQKHLGFKEEREWRAIYSPKRNPSSLMESSTETVRGVPQMIYKVPMDVGHSPALEDIDFARIFDRLIIGPTQYPLTMLEAFVSALKAAGVMDAEKRVVVSSIPIRT